MKGLRGSVTLFVAMVFLVIMSLFVVTVRSARISGAQVITKTASSMALDSVFAEYDDDLFSKFGILLFDEGKNKDIIEGRLTEYMSYNVDADKGLIFSGARDLYGIDFKGVNVTKTIHANVYGGLFVQNEAVEYEKYAKPVNLAADYLGLGEESEEAKAVNEISEDIAECGNCIVCANNAAKMLIEKIDGIECTSAGIDFSNLRIHPVFVKQFCTVEPTRESLNIENEAIYEYVKEWVGNPIDMLDIYAEYMEKGHAAKAEKHLENSISYVDQMIKNIEDCEFDLGMAEYKLSDLDAGVSELEKTSQEKSGIINEDTLNELSQEIDAMKGYRDIMKETICDMDAIKTTLSYDLTVLKKFRDELTLLPGTDYKTQVEKCKSIICRYSFEGLAFEYEGLEAVENNSNLVDALEGFFDIGVLSFAKPDDRSISEKNIKGITGLSTACCSNNTEKFQSASDTATILEKRMVFIEYIMDNFCSFTDENQDGRLDYQVEYILAGKKSDKSNIAEVAKELTLLRSGMNMVYILTDSAKKEQMHGIAMALVGFTGIEVLVKIVQYALLYFWSYFEGIADVKVLLDGGKVPIKKNKDNWKLSFENAITMNVDTSKEANKKGLDYESYLRFLLYTKDDYPMVPRTMDLIELYMINSGREDFRLSNYVYGLEIDYAYELNGINNEYIGHSANTY